MHETETTTLHKIHAAARAEFLEKGYQEASLRSIVKQAGVTTGAFYGYYRSKKELFDALVGEHYAALLAIYRDRIDGFTRLSPQAQRFDMQEYSARGIRQMTAYIYDHLTAFKLILCCADGTEYDHLIHELAQMDLDATRDFSAVMEEAGMPMRAVNPQLEHMLTSGMFSAYFEMVVHDIPRENADEYTAQLLDFYTAGWKKIMGF